MNQISRRALQAIFTIYAAITISFVIIDQLEGRVETSTALYLGLNPDSSLFEQYITYVFSMLQGDLGRSIRFNEPVLDILLSALPWTLFIVILSFVIGIGAGAVLASLEGTQFDPVAIGISTLANSVPYYVVALLLLLIPAYQLGWFPTGGRASSTEAGLTLDYFVGVIHHAALPVLSFVIATVGVWALAMRKNSTSILGKEYQHVARSHERSTIRSGTDHATRNLILPSYMTLLVVIGSIFSGSIILEIIFTYPGVGYYMIEALIAQDYSLMTGAFVIITTAAVLCTLVVELVFSVISLRSGSDASNPLEDDDVYNESSSDVSRSAESEFNTSNRENTLRTDTLLGVRDNVSGTVQIRWNDWRTGLGVLLLVVYVLAGTVGVYFIGHPSVNQGPRMLQPFENMNYLLGTDNLGRDLLSLVVYSIQPMFKMVIAGAVFSTTLALVVGAVSGYARGALDRVLMMITDIVIAIPGLPLLAGLAVVFQSKNLYFLGILLTINAWPGLARAVRSQIITTQSQDNAEASRSRRQSSSQIVDQDIQSTILSYSMINIANMARQVVFVSVALYFLGILPYANISLGILMNSGFQSGALYTEGTAHLLIVPMVAIVGLIGALVLISQRKISI